MADNEQAAEFRQRDSESQYLLAQAHKALDAAQREKDQLTKERDEYQRAANTLHDQWRTTATLRDRDESCIARVRAVINAYADSTEARYHPLWRDIRAALNARPETEGA